MADLQQTLQFLTPYFSTVEEVIGALSLFVGGIFGIYLIAIIIRFIFLRKVFKSYKQIEDHLARLEKKMDALAKKRPKKS